jgi:predicted transposase/invertase (TIGR01784 family)
LKAGEDYRDLPRAVLISILDFELFDCEALHSKFAFLEQSRQELLTDRMELHFFELPKIPKKIDMDDKMQLWLKVLDAQTEEELEELEKLEVSEVAQAVAAYRSITARDEFKELERLRAKARHDEAGALKNAERREREKWRKVVADKDATIADKEATIAELRAQLASNKK